MVQVTSVKSEWEYPPKSGAVILAENNKPY
jgi:hypothetical protein